MELKTCAGPCGGTYPVVFFSPNRVATHRHRIVLGMHNTKPDRRPVCRGCEQTHRDVDKQANRLKPKLYLSLRRHAKKYGLTVPDFQQQYGWNLDRMIRDAEHAYATVCPYCEKPFSGMAHGLNDLTVDIVDPRQPPHYTVNVEYACRTCNVEKGRTPPEEWAIKLQCWKQWQTLKDRGPLQPALPF